MGIKGVSISFSNLLAKKNLYIHPLSLQSLNIDRCEIFIVAIIAGGRREGPPSTLENIPINWK